MKQIAKISEIKKSLREKFPEALVDNQAFTSAVFKTGLTSFDQLFPSGGIPYGQLIELTGPAGSGKTSLLWRLVAQMTKRAKVAYVDLSKNLFPPSAEVCGVALDSLIIARPDSLAEAARITELLLRQKLCGAVICDLVRLPSPKVASEVLNIPWCHRLRSRTARAKGLVIFMTENNSEIIPPSMVALRLEVTRVGIKTVRVQVTKSCISPEGASAEVLLW